MEDKLIRAFEPDGVVAVDYLGKPFSGMTTLIKDIAMMMNKEGYNTLADCIKCRVYFKINTRKIPNV